MAAHTLSVAGGVGGGPSLPARTGTWTGGCAQAEATGAFSYEQVRDAYGIDQLGTGAGASIAILGLTEVPSARDIADNARCFAYQKLRSRTLLTDGETLPVPTGLFEPQEDLALARGMAPDASLIFTQAWSGSDMWFLGAAQVLDGRELPGELLDLVRNLRERRPRQRPRCNAVDPCGRQPARLSSDPARAGRSGRLRLRRRLRLQLQRPALQRGRLAGILAVSDRGRRNAADPHGLEPAPRRGGVERPEMDAGSDGGGAGGGGYSLTSARPPFQLGLGLPGNRRAVPDLSAAASSFPGWPVVLGGHWTVDGGTSAAAPLVAAAMAVVSADLQRQHLPPVGPADGLFYYLARCRPGAL